MPGYHSVVWNAKDDLGLSIPAGIYIARLVTAEYTKSIKACPEFGEGCCF